MIIYIKRVARRTTYTQGYLFIGKEYFCDTLEPAEAIPPGLYPVRLGAANRRSRQPLLLSVPGRRRISLRSGCTPCETRGNILVGRNAPVGWIGDTHRTHSLLRLRILTAIVRKQRVMVLIG